MGWPGTLGNTAEAATCSLGIYSTDNDGHCFFYGPKVRGLRWCGVVSRGRACRPASVAAQCCCGCCMSRTGLMPC